MHFFKIKKVPKCYSLNLRVKDKILLFSKIWRHATSEFGIDFTKEQNVLHLLNLLFLAISSRIEK